METTMNATTVALTDYIISLPDAISKGGADYEVVLTNNTDFIVRRRTQTKERDLIHSRYSQFLNFVEIK